MAELGKELFKQLTSNDETAKLLAEALGAADIEDTMADGKEKQTQAQTLIAISMDAELFHTPDNECYATIPVSGHKENWLIRTKGFRNWLVQRFYEAKGKPPSAQALQDALGVLEAKAQFDGPEMPVFTRLAEKGDAIYLDLANDAWEAVEVTPYDWRVIADPVSYTHLDVYKRQVAR